MKLPVPPDLDYDPDLKTWLSRMAVQANQEAGVFLVDVGNSKAYAYQPVWLGAYCMAHSSAAALGYINFNRNATAGTIIDSDHGAYQLVNIDGVFYLQIFNSAGTFVGNHYFDNSGNAYLLLNCSADSFTDRTPSYEGDAVSELTNIASKDGGIDHATLPDFVKKEVSSYRPIDPDDLTKGYREVKEPGRDLGANISMLNVAIKQLAERLDAAETANDSLSKQVMALTKRVEELEKAKI